MASNSPFRTQDELINEALANLGVLSPGQPVDIEDFNYVAEKAPSVWRMLAALEICYVSDPQNIPGAWFSPLADILAGEVATKFGSNPDHYTVLIQRGLGVPPGAGAAALALKQMLMGRPTYEPLQMDFF
jgi:hypothetical protein